MTTPRPIRLLCTGDLHLGRYPTRVDADIPELTTAHVWRGIVERAIELNVHALVLTGDVVDEDNKFFESYGSLKRGLEQLAEAGIPCFAVSGNHDHDVLPSLHDALGGDAFRLVGRGGRWETVPLVVGGEPVLEFCGWSFPARHHDSSPLDTFEHAPHDEVNRVPVIGLLHADVDQPDSRYAPVSLADLGACSVDAWLLGHIHRPTSWPHRSGCILYPGSPQPLRTGESGVHGAWLVEVEATGEVRTTPLAGATIHYSECTVDLTGVDAASDFREAVVAAVNDHCRTIEERQDGLERIVLSLTFTGRTSLHARIRQLAEEIDDEIPAGRTTAVVAERTVATQPDVDIRRLSTGNDPVGVVARLILALDSDEEPEPDVRRLIGQLTQTARSHDRKNAYTVLRQQPGGITPLDPDDAAAMLRDQAMTLLDHMLAQKTVDAE